MAVIVDTSVLIAHERGAFDLDGFLAALEPNDAAISAITASELLHGVERTPNGARRIERADNVADVLEAFAVVPFGVNEARHHARVWAALKRGGNAIGAYDLIVAAIALANEASVATLNQKEFKRVPGLTLESVAKFVRKQ
jgi:tRNA(fMet)-specific endonuclease VapC